MARNNNAARRALAPYNAPVPGPLVTRNNGAVATPNPPSVPIELAGVEYTREYLSGDGYFWLAQYVKALPRYIDDVTSDLGDDLYEQMAHDAACKSALHTLKAGTLGDGLVLTSAVPDKHDDGYALAATILDFCRGVIEDLEPSIDHTLWDLMDAMHLGNRLAELVYEVRPYRGVPLLHLTSVKVKPNISYAYALDAYNNLVGVLGLIPGVAFPVLPGQLLIDPRKTPNLLPHEKFAILTIRPKENDPRGTALDPETPVPTPDGWTTMEDIRAGGKVFDERGRVRYVTAKQEWWDRPCFEITFRDGSSIVADENHLWPTQTVYERKNGGTTIRTTREMYENIFDIRGKTRYGIPQAGPLDYPEQMLPMPPYFLGLWLGDGTAITADIACHAQDLEETVLNIRACGYSATSARNGTSDLGRSIRVRGDGLWDPAGPVTALRLLGVRGNKHIPASYLRGSVQQRTDLLAGLMDSDGYIDKDGRCEFANTNRNLVEGVAELVRSLGSTAHTHLRQRGGLRKDGHICQDVWATKFTPTVNPFRLARKRARVINVRPYTRHYITSIVPVAPRRTICIEVDSPSHLYLAGTGMVPTHNSILRPAYTSWWQKMQVWPEYLKYLTQFASPLIAAIMAPNTNPVPLRDALGNVLPGQFSSPGAALLAALEQLRGGAAIVLPNGTTLDIKQSAGDGTAFLKAFEYQDLQISLAVLSQTLATGGHKNNTKAAAQVHQDVLSTLIRQLKNMLRRVIRRQILGRMVSYNWGDEAARRLTPNVGLGTVEQPDQAAVLTALGKVPGFTLVPSQLQGTYELAGLPPADPTEIAAIVSMQQAQQRLTEASTVAQLSAGVGKVGMPKAVAPSADPEEEDPPPDGKDNPDDKEEDV